MSHVDSDIEIFWGEIPPCDHLVQIYHDDAVFLYSLEGFVGGGLRSGDGVLLIATPAHLKALEDRLKERGRDVENAHLQDQYIALDAEDTLSKFIVKGWPDEKLFKELVTNLIVRARGKGRRVRAFGEMVAVLWARGHNGATVRLEHLWHQLCQEQGFSLFCAYPNIGFTQDLSASMKEICAAHSRVIGHP
jgi:hypothetical protein